MQKATTQFNVWQEGLYGHASAIPLVQRDAFQDYGNITRTGKFNIEDITANGLRNGVPPENLQKNKLLQKKQLNPYPGGTRNPFQKYVAEQNFYEINPLGGRSPEVDNLVSKAGNAPLNLALDEPMEIMDRIFFDRLKPADPLSAMYAYKHMKPSDPYTQMDARAQGLAAYQSNTYEAQVQSLNNLFSTWAGESNNDAAIRASQSVNYMAMDHTPVNEGQIVGSNDPNKTMDGLTKVIDSQHGEKPGLILEDKNGNEVNPADIVHAPPTTDPIPVYLPSAPATGEKRLQDNTDHSSKKRRKLSRAAEIGITIGGVLLGTALTIATGGAAAPFVGGAFEAAAAGLGLGAAAEATAAGVGAAVGNIAAGAAIGSATSAAAGAGAGYLENGEEGAKEGAKTGAISGAIFGAVGGAGSLVGSAAATRVGANTIAQLGTKVGVGAIAGAGGQALTNVALGQDPLEGLKSGAVYGASGVLVSHVGENIWGQAQNYRNQYRPVAQNGNRVVPPPPADLENHPTPVRRSIRPTVPTPNLEHPQPVYVEEIPRLDPLNLDHQFQSVEAPVQRQGARPVYDSWLYRATQFMNAPSYDMNNFQTVSPDELTYMNINYDTSSRAAPAIRQNLAERGITQDNVRQLRPRDQLNAPNRLSPGATPGMVSSYDPLIPTRDAETAYISNVLNNQQPQGETPEGLQTFRKLAKRSRRRAKR